MKTTAKKKAIAPEHRVAAEDAAAQHADDQFMRQILSCVTAVKDGNFAVRLPSDLTGLGGKVADALNEIVAANQQMSEELETVSVAVGKQGKIRRRARFG